MSLFGKMPLPREKILPSEETLPSEKTLPSEETLPSEKTLPSEMCLTGKMCLKGKMPGRAWLCVLVNIVVLLLVGVWVDKAYALREELDSDFIAVRDNAMVSGLSMTEDKMQQNKSATSSFSSPSQREVVSKEDKMQQTKSATSSFSSPSQREVVSKEDQMQQNKSATSSFRSPSQREVVSKEDKMQQNKSATSSFRSPSQREVVSKEDKMQQTKSARSSFRSSSQREVVSKEAVLLQKELKESKQLMLPTVNRSEYNLADVDATAKVPIWIGPSKPLMRREKGKPLRVWSISVYDDNNPPLGPMFTTAQALLDRGIIDEVHYHDFGCKSNDRAHKVLRSHKALTSEIIVEQRNKIKPSAVGPLATHRAAQSMSIWPRYCTPSMVYDLYARIAENDDVILFSESTLLEYPTPEKVERLLLTAQTQHKEVAWSANLINNAVTSWMHQALRVLPFSIASLDIPSGDGLKSDLDINGALAYKLALHYARNKEAYSSMDGYVSVPTGVGMNLDFAAVRGERLQQAQKHILNGLHPVVALTQKVAQEQAAPVKVDLGVLAVQGARATQSAYGRDIRSVIAHGTKTFALPKPVDHPTSRVFNQSRSENLNIWMIFAGRRNRLELQVGFWIEAIEKGFIDEVHLWDYTCLYPNRPDRKENQDYLIELSSTYPWIFVLDSPCNGWIPAYSFYQIWLREQDVVIKADDDIIYVRVDAIPGFTAAVREHPILDIVSANVINNGVCAYFMQAHAGCSTPEEIDVMEYPENGPHNGFGGTLWETRKAAMRVHEHFVKNPTCYFSMQGLQKYSERLSINFFAWSGAKADRVAWYASFGSDDEFALTYMWNTVDKGQEAIYNPLIVSHATFGSDQQHAYDFIVKLYKDAKLPTSLR